MQSRPKGVVVIAALAAAAVLGSTTYLQGYVTLGHAWGSNTVPYYVNPSNKWVSQAAAISAVQTAAAGWHDQTNANIQLVYAGQTNGSSLTLNYKNEVFFRDAASSAGNVAETWYWWDGSGRLVDADLVFYEGAYHFYAGSGCTDGVYIENVGIHEFGHALGMKHSEFSGVTMQPAMTSYCDRSQLTLEADDKAGIESIYRPTSGTTGNTAPVTSIATPTNNASYLDTSTITFSGSAADNQDGNLSSSLRWSSSLQGQIGTGATFSRSLVAGTHTITASVTDSGGLSASAQTSIVVTIAAVATAPPAPTASSVMLTTRAYKVRGRQKVDLSWSAFSATTVDIYRDGSVIRSVPNSRSFTDDIDGRGGASYTYKVCGAGTSTCSNSAIAKF